MTSSPILSLVTYQCIVWAAITTAFPMGSSFLSTTWQLVSSMPAVCRTAMRVDEMVSRVDHTRSSLIEDLSDSSICRIQNSPPGSIWTKQIYASKIDGIDLSRPIGNHRAAVEVSKHYLYSWRLCRIQRKLC